MNIYEALKHNCRIRRKGWEAWHEMRDPMTLHILDIKADDWEVEGPTITLSYNEYIHLISESMKEELAKRSHIYVGDITTEVHTGTIGRLTMKLFPSEAKVLDEPADK